MSNIYTVLLQNTSCRWPARPTWQRTAETKAIGRGLQVHSRCNPYYSRSSSSTRRKRLRLDLTEEGWPRCIWKLVCTKHQRFGTAGKSNATIVTTVTPLTFSARGLLVQAYHFISTGNTSIHTVSVTFLQQQPALYTTHGAAPHPHTHAHTHPHTHT